MSCLTFLPYGISSTRLSFCTHYAVRGIISFVIRVGQIVSGHIDSWPWRLESPWRLVADVRAVESAQSTPEVDIGSQKQTFISAPGWDSRHYCTCLFLCHSAARVPKQLNSLLILVWSTPSFSYSSQVEDICSPWRPQGKYGMWRGEELWGHTAAALAGDGCGVPGHGGSGKCLRLQRLRQRSQEDLQLHTERR